MFGTIAKHNRSKGKQHRFDGFRRLSMEVLEDRLALTWVGVPPASVPVPTSAIAITLNAQNDATGTSNIASTEVDYVKFTATASGSYTISATTPSSSLDTVLGVFSNTGQRLAYNDDISYPTNTDSRLQMKLAAGSVYYIGVTNYSSGSRGAYTWTVEGPASSTTPLVDDAYENNDSLLTAYNFGTLSGPKVVGGLVMADGLDWYRFTMTSVGTTSSSVSISFLNSQGNLQLALYSQTGTLIASSTGTGNTEAVSLNGLAAGSYYIDVFGNGGVQNPNYTLTIGAPTPPVAPNPNNSFNITLNMTGLTNAQKAIFQQAAARWSQVITADIPNATYHGIAVDDILIDASAVRIDGVNGILGQAAPDTFRPGSDLPIHGFMQFDTADLAALQASGQLVSVILHEMGHVLGIGTIWEDKGLLSGAGSADPIFIGTNATAQYNLIFGTTAAGVPVENMGGPGTVDSHWRESVLDNELMTGYLNPGVPNPLSRITIGSLQDLGYTVNYAAADTYTKPAGAIVGGRAFGNGSASLRSGFVNLTMPDGSSATPFAFAALRLPEDNQATASLLAITAPAISANLADSAAAQYESGGAASELHAVIQSHSHDLDGVDQVCSDIAEGWNPILQPAFA